MSLVTFFLIPLYIYIFLIILGLDGVSNALVAETGVANRGELTFVPGKVNSRSFAEQLSTSRISMSASLLASRANSRQSLVGNSGSKVC